RSFYIGEEIEENEVKAKFEDGILKVFVPKKEAAPQVEERKYISIEG
ncbi:MAG: Hsp20 family protein, partial [Lachnospiraceae bacterium]|nr:Hsp20 family protein [Lachnospiraceae bacterium]